MCGFVGYVGQPGILPPEQLARATETLAHRGPDGAGSWMQQDGRVLFGHRRLAIVDLSPAAAQPMESAKGTSCIVYNGEIYNHPELREELAAQGHAFRTRSDTEVLLAAYEAWGAACLPRLNGMFAFAVWDEERRVLFAARDRFGEKPLYYYIGNGFLLFASEIKALLATGLVAARANERAIYRYLALREIDAGEETPFAGIRALPQAHCLTYTPSTHALSVSRYWALDPDHRTSLRDDEAYAERFRELLSDSVRIRLRSDVPVGSSLSGGLDSSSVVCLMARELTGGTQRTFSARFRDPRYDEGPYIERVNRWAGTIGSEVFPDPARLPQEMEQLMWHQEEPFFSTSIYAQWCVMRLAKDEGVTVLLDGQGGDETLAGYQTYVGPHFRDLLRRLRWATLARESAAYLRKHGSSGLPLLLYTMLPSGLRQPIRRRVRPQALQQDFAKSWRHEEERAEERFRTGLDNAQFQTLTRTMLPVLLRYADRNSMAFSREVRLPFLDHRLVEFLLAIPTDQRLRGTTTKFILRESLRGVLPEEIRTRKDKLGYAPPQGDWLRGSVRGWVDELLTSRSFAQRGWIDVPRARQTWEEYLAGCGAAESQVWRWAALEAWARVFLDGKVAAA